MKYLFRGSVLGMLLVVAVACAPALSEQEGRTRGSPNLITQEEIQASAASNAFELVQSLRPNWLRQRGVTSPNPEAMETAETLVYMNQSRIGGLAELRNIPLGGITSMEFLDARTATQRWGTGHTFGAIVVSTQPRGR